MRDDGETLHNSMQTFPVAHLYIQLCCGYYVMESAPRVLLQDVSVAKNMQSFQIGNLQIMLSETQVIQNSYLCIRLQAVPLLLLRLVQCIKKTGMIKNGQAKS